MLNIIFQNDINCTRQNINTMHLHLKNFRCYEDTKFDFGDKGLVLLSGSSGKGKSTILMAIDFALFGNGTKILTHGKKSCSVSLQMGDLKIVRKKGPNHLLVNDIYEDDAGEAIIQQKFGKMFNSVSYIPQNPKKSFVMMSPSDRLEFLETFAFKDFDISILKERAKSVIREANDTLSKTIGSLKFASDMLSEKCKPNSIPFPAKVKEENRDKFIANEEVKLKNSMLLIRKNEKRLSDLKETQKRIEISKVKVEEKKKLLLSLSAEKEDVQKQLSNTDYKGDENLDKIQAKLKLLLQNKEFNDLSKVYKENVEKLEQLMTQEEAEMKSKIAEYESSLWSDGSELEIREQIEVWTALLTLKKEIFQLDKELQKLPKKYEGDANTTLAETRQKIREIQKELEILKLENESLFCPHCSKRVRFQNNKLVNMEHTERGEKKDFFELQSQLKNCNLAEKELLNVIETEKKRSVLEEKMERLKRNESELEDETSSITECEESLFSLREILRKNEEDEKKLQKLQTNLSQKIFSQTTLNIKAQISVDKKKIDSLRMNEIVEDDDEEELRNDISTQKGEKEAYLSLSKTLANILQKEAQFSSEISQIEGELTQTTTEEIKRQIEAVTSEIHNHTERKEKIEIFLKELDKWRANEKEVLDYKKLSQSVEDLRQKETEDRKKYKSACTFRDNILEAESIYVSNLIDNINNNVQMYLDHFSRIIP